MDTTMAPAHPSIFATLALDPLELAEDKATRLSVTAVLHASRPITICTWNTILNLHLAQFCRRPTGKGFICVDVDTNVPLRLYSVVCSKRNPIRYEIDDSDSQYFHTLQPEIPYKFSGSSVIPHKKLAAGHRYRLSMGEKDEVGWWKYGVKEDILVSPGQEIPGDIRESSGEPITITNAGPIEFTVSLHWENTWITIYPIIKVMWSLKNTEISESPSVTASISVDISNLAGHLTAELSIITVSHGLVPITIWIWPTALRRNYEQGFSQGSGDSGAFSLTRLDSDTMLPTQESFRISQSGMIHPKDRYFHTLQPEQPYRFAAPFTLHLLKELETRPGVYRLALIDKVELKWWKEATREEIITPLGQKSSKDMFPASGKPIILTGIEPIEFRIPARE